MSRFDVRKFDTLLLNAEKGYKNKISEDNTFFNDLVENYLEDKIKWDPKTITQMQISMESNKGRVRVPGKFPPRLIREKGHTPLEFLKSYFRCLVEAFTICSVSTKSKDKEILSYIREELMILNMLIFTSMEREKSIAEGNLSDHILYMEGLLQSIKDEKTTLPIQYEIGYPDHAFYIVYAKRKGKLRGTIFNLGEGCLRHRYQYDSVNKIYKIRPFIIEVSDIRNHLVNIIYWLELFTFRGKIELTDDIVNDITYHIYNDSGKYYGSLDILEKEQSTGNCVSKNYFFAMRARMSDKNFYTIYKKSISVLLSYKIHFNEGTYDIDPQKTKENIKDALEDFEYTEMSTSSNISLYGDPTHLEYPGGISKDGIPALQYKKEDLQEQKERTAKAIAGFSAFSVAAYTYSVQEDDTPTWLKITASGISGGLAALASYYGAMHIQDLLTPIATEDEGLNIRVKSEKSFAKIDFDDDKPFSKENLKDNSKDDRISKNRYGSFSPEQDKAKENKKESDNLDIPTTGVSLKGKAPA